MGLHCTHSGFEGFLITELNSEDFETYILYMKYVETKKEVYNRKDDIIKIKMKLKKKLGNCNHIVFRRVFRGDTRILFRTPKLKLI